MLEKKIHTQLSELLTEKDYRSVKTLLTACTPQDIALLLDDVAADDVLLLFRLLPKELAAETFVEMDSDLQERLLQNFTDTELRGVIAELFVDDMVNIIEEMPGYGDAAWVGFNRMDATMQTNGSIGIITVDLGAASSVSGFAIEVFEDSAAGITFPSKVEFFYSTDNETWTSVGEGTKSGEGSVAEFALTLDSAVNASYVKVEMTCGASNWVFVSEFEAFGTAGSVLLVRGSLDVLTFFLFLLVASRLYDPLQGALQNLAAIISTRTNIARMNEILDHPIQQGDSRLTNEGCDIVFDHVGFSYNDGEAVLRDVSFTAKQGEVTALVGPSGGGKTTVSRLAARFWDCTRGQITVGGMDVSKTDPEVLLSLFSIVFQDVTLFDNTILENIRIGNKNATDEEVLAAARLANCDVFAEQLPDGWNTNIGENGCALSGGERQRISIARLGAEPLSQPLAAKV